MGRARPATPTRCSTSCRTTDVLFVLGGDGTFLRAARAVAEVDVPLLGINLGKVGFLSKVEADELEPVLAQLATAATRSRSGWRSRARIQPAAGGDATATHHALNDIVVARGRSRGSSAWTSHRRLAPRDVHRRRPRRRRARPAPPGYSFSAGGPILDPHSRNLIVTPIAGVPLRDPVGRRRPEPDVRCRIVDANEALVSIDGREDLPLASATSSRSGALDRPIRLVEPQGALPFWDLLRHKVELLPS